MHNFTTVEDAEAIATLICKMPINEIKPEIATIHKELQTTRSKLLELSSMLAVSLKLQSLGILKTKAR